MWGKSVALMPIPLSLPPTLLHPLIHKTKTDLAPGGVYLMAFVTRLRIAAASGRSPPAAGPVCPALRCGR
jgi:hypothetical protein